MVLLGNAASASAGGPSAPRHVVVKAYAADGLTEAERRGIERSLARGVRGAMDGAKVAAATPEGAISEAAEKALERSDKGLAEAIKRMRNLEDGALDLLDWAADEYQRYLPQLMARDGNAGKLIEVYERTAIASYLAGDEKSATEALRKAFVLQPDLDYDRKIFPPQLEKLVVNERLYHDELGHGSVRVEADQAAGGGAATVYINGVERGRAPVTVDELPAGPNIVSLVTPGAEPVIVIAQVAGGGDLVTVKAAVKTPKSVDRGPLAKTRGDVGGPHAAPPIARAAKNLGADALVLALPTVHDDEIAVVAYVYDMRSGALVGRSEDTLPRTGPDAEELGGQLMATVTWKPSIALGPKKPPIWKHKYFWPAVGAAAGVVVVAVVVGIATHGLSNGEKVSILPVLRF